MSEIGAELQQLPLEALVAAVDSFTNGEQRPYVFVFFVDETGQGHTVAIADKEGSVDPNLVESARQAVSQGFGQLARRYALAYDGYLTTDGERSDAAIVEAGERGEPEAFLIAQRYRVKKRSRKIERIGPPEILGTAEPLLG